MLLKGVIDCPDLPLNVSRSALQNDGFVKKISDYISKKVAEKLAGLCKTDKDNYDKYWDDISPFIKYGCLKDDKFCEKMNDYILFKNLDGKYLTLPDALQINKEAEEAAKQEATDENGQKVEAEVVDADGNPVADADRTAESEKKDDAADKAEDKKEKEPRIIYYVTDEQQQSQYINMFKAQKMDAFILNSNIDTPFIQQLESKNEGIRFQRIDADLTDTFKSKTSKKAEEELAESEKKLGEKIKKALKNDKMNVKLQKLKDKKVSSMLTVSEDSRRMADMMKMYSMNGMGAMGDFGNEGQTLILNANHPLVKYVMEHEEGENVDMICEQLYDLARLQNAPLDAAAMSRFVSRSNDIMMLLTR